MTTSTRAISRQSDQITQIPDESHFKYVGRPILLQISTYLTPKELCTLARVNRKWSIISETALYRFFIAKDFNSLLSQEGRCPSKEIYQELKRSWVHMTIKSIEIPKLNELKEEGSLQFTDVSVDDKMIVMERYLGGEEGSELEGFRYYILNFDGIQQHGYQTPDRSLVRKMNHGFILTQRNEPPYTIELWNRTDPNFWFEFPQSAAFLFNFIGSIYVLFINNSYELRLNYCTPFSQILGVTIANVKIDEKIKFEAFAEGFFIYKKNQLWLLNPLEKGKDIKTDFTSDVDFSQGKMQSLGNWNTLHTDTDYLIWDRQLNQVFTGSFQDILSLCEGKFGKRLPDASFKGLHLTDQGFILDFTNLVVRFTDPKDLDVEWIDASLITVETHGNYLFVQRDKIMQAYDLNIKAFVTFERVPKEEKISSWVSYLELIFLGTQEGNIYILNNLGQCIHAFHALDGIIKKIKCLMQSVKGVESVRLVTVSDKNELKIWTY